MKRSKRICSIMYNLLIVNGMDGFSVMEARDASLSIDGAPSDLDEARKRVYRQLWQFERNGWLKSEGEGRNKKYFQTEFFKSYHLLPKEKAVAEVTESKNSIEHYSNLLVDEFNKYKGELEIVLGEIAEYQSLKERFPELEIKLLPLLEKARERSALLLGKINVLKNVLKVLSEDLKTC